MIKAGLTDYKIYKRNFKVGTHDGTSSCDYSLQQVVGTSRIVRTAKSSRRDQNLVLATSPTNSNWFEFVGLVAAETKVGPCD